MTNHLLAVLILIGLAILLFDVAGVLFGDFLMRTP